MSTRNQNNVIRRAMKKVAVGIIAALGLTLLQSVPAKAVGETVVIVDNMFDSGRSEIKNNVVYEICWTSGDFCKATSDRGRLEGIGASSAPSTLVYRDSQTRHGTDLALVVIKVDPNARLILIRTSGINNRGTVNNVSDMNLYVKHFEWIAQNKDKYNIAAVVFSKATSRFGANNSCTTKSSDEQLVSSIKKLTAINVAVMAGTGNDRSFDRTKFPSCIKETVSVSSTVDWQESIDEIQANHGPDVDFYALGYWNLPTGRSTGTSLANAALAAYWVKNYKGSYQSTYEYLKSLGKTLKGSRASTNSFVDVNK